MEFDYYHVEESTSQKFEEYFKFGTFKTMCHVMPCSYKCNGFVLYVLLYLATRYITSNVRNRHYT